MADGYTTTDLLDFLEHAAARGLMPAATAQAMAVACRTVFGILSDEEQADVRRLDLDTVTRRFHNKRARDFSPGSLRDYTSRLRRAVALFLAWREDPANFRAPTRASKGTRRQKPVSSPSAPVFTDTDTTQSLTAASAGAASVSATVSRLRPGYQTAVPLRAGHIVTLTNIPEDLSVAEAERLAQFVRMLAVRGQPGS